MSESPKIAGAVEIHLVHQRLQPMSTRFARTTIAAAALLLILAPLTACKPANIFLEIDNKSGGTLHNVKLTFPGDHLIFRSLEDSTDTGTYRSFAGPGELAISYSTDDGQTHDSTGPQVTGNEKGRVTVTISGSYANFDTKFDEAQQ
jgi:hypothetical protein